MIKKELRREALAQRRGTSMSRLVDEMATLLLAESDAESRFAIRAERGKNREQAGIALFRKASGGPSI